MTIVRPKDYTIPSVADWRTGDDVNGSDFGDVVEMEHAVFSRAGSRVPGLYYPGAWKTTSTTFTAVNENATQVGPDLDIWRPSTKITRAYAGDIAGFSIKLTGQNIVARLTAHTIDSAGTATLLATLDMTIGATKTVASQKHTASFPTYFRDNRVRYKLTAHVYDTAIAAEGSIWEWYLTEHYTATSEIP